MGDITFDLLVAVMAFFAGVIGALIGLGGGVIITPVLVLGFGVDIRYAMGAALASVIATSSGAAAAYLRDGISNMRIGMFLCTATTVGAVCGAMLAVVLNQDTLSIIFGAALLVTVALSCGKNQTFGSAGASDPLAVKLHLPGTMPVGAERKPYAVHAVIPGFLMMWVAGVLSGLLGIGSGAFKVVAMDQIMRIPFKVTTATSNFMIGVTAAGQRGHLPQARLSRSRVGRAGGPGRAGWSVCRSQTAAGGSGENPENRIPHRRIGHCGTNDRPWVGHPHRDERRANPKQPREGDGGGNSDFRDDHFCRALLVSSRQSGLKAADHIFSGEPKYFENPVSMIQRAFEVHAVGHRRSVIMIGVILLLISPAVRVAFAMCGFALQKDRLYTLISLIVLVVLLFSFFW